MYSISYGNAFYVSVQKVIDTLLSHSQEDMSEQDDNCSTLMTALQMKITLR